MKIPKGWQIISTLFSKGWQKGWKTNTFFRCKRVANYTFHPFWMLSI